MFQEHWVEPDLSPNEPSKSSDLHNRALTIRRSELVIAGSESPTNTAFELTSSIDMTLPLVTPGWQFSTGIVVPSKWKL